MLSFSSLCFRSSSLSYFLPLYSFVLPLYPSESIASVVAAACVWQLYLHLAITHLKQYDSGIRWWPFLSEKIDIPQQMHELGLFALPLLLDQNLPEKIFRLNPLMMLTLLYFMQANFGGSRQKLYVSMQKKLSSANLRFVRALFVRRENGFLIFC